MSTTPIVTTSLVVSFDSDVAEAGPIYNAIVDDRDSGHNNGKTRFSPGDEVYILLFKSAEVATIGVAASKGLVTKVGIDNYLVEGFVTFNPDSLDSDTGYPMPAGGLSEISTDWIGNQLGNLITLGYGSTHSVFKVNNPPTATTQVNLQNNDNPTITKTLDVLNPFVGVLKYSFNAPCEVWRLNNTLITNEEEYSIAVHFTGVAHNGWTIT